MRKITFLFSKVFIFILLFLGFFTTKNVFAVGTCSCTVNGSGSVVLYVNNCDVVNEYPSGCEGSAVGNPYAKCECVKKENSGLPVNKCTCNGFIVTASNCQGSTPREYCVSRGFDSYCYCDKETSNLTDEYIPPRPDTPEANSNIITCTTVAGETGVNTSFGCIPIDMNQFASWFLQIIFGIAGGIAFLLMVYGFILMSTSGGDEKKVQGAKETVTSAITGLLVSIFALFIFKLIAVNILHIPGIN